MHITYATGSAPLKPFFQKREVNECGYEMDDRIVLLGDLNLVDRTCGFVESNNKYHHIIFTFWDFSCEVSDVIEDVLAEYLQFLLSAYRKDEFYCYAERHAPKVKSILDVATNKRIERLDHTHLIIPRVNLLSGEEFDLIGDVNDDFGSGEKKQVYLDAIEAHLNDKFDLDK